MRPHPHEMLLTTISMLGLDTGRHEWCQTRRSHSCGLQCSDCIAVMLIHCGSTKPPRLDTDTQGVLQESGALRDYLLFAAAAGVSGGWFIGHHHWHLDIHLGAWSLQHLCGALVAGLACALALPGLAVCRAPRILCGAVGISQVRAGLAGVGVDVGDETLALACCACVRLRECLLLLAVCCPCSLRGAFQLCPEWACRAAWLVECVWLMCARPVSTELVPT